MYTKDWCPFCFRAKRLLHKRKYDFQEINLTGNVERRAWLAEKSGQGTVPQIFIHGKGIGGFTELEALDRAGGLDPLVKGA
ncbi:MAG: glutaredoxin domain-containing protein [Polyangiaceae bacterium]